MHEVVELVIGPRYFDDGVGQSMYLFAFILRVVFGVVPGRGGHRARGTRDSDMSSRPRRPYVGLMNEMNGWTAEVGLITRQISARSPMIFLPMVGNRPPIDDVAQPSSRCHDRFLRFLRV